MTTTAVTSRISNSSTTASSLVVGPEAHLPGPNVNLCPRFRNFFEHKLTLELKI